MRHPLHEDEFQGLMELWQFSPLLPRGFQDPRVTQETLHRLVTAGWATPIRDTFGQTRYARTPEGMRVLKADDRYRVNGLQLIEPPGESGSSSDA